MRSTLLLLALVACSSPFQSASEATPTPKVAYIGSIGSNSCAPGATFPGRAPEAGFDSPQGSLWVLVFGPIPPTAKTDTKIVWRMTGSGNITIAAKGPDGTELKPSSQQQVAGLNASTWNHPGNELRTFFTFPRAGCWHFHLSR